MPTSRCTQCGFESPEGLRFCGQCGAQLAAICPSCSRPNPPTFRFCGNCGTALSPPEPRQAVTAAAGPFRPAEPQSYTPPHLASRILTGRSALEGERKQVTVLFADVAGFTTLAEKPEERRKDSRTSSGYLTVAELAT
jgi:Double zinc ribbon